MLRWICDNIRMDRIKNQEFRVNLGVAPMSMLENRLGWFGHAKRKSVASPVKRIKSLIVEGKEVEKDLRKRGGAIQE